MTKLAPFLLLTGLLHGQELLVPSTTSLLEGTQFYPAANISNGSGLSAPPDAANYADVTHAPASSSTAWTTDAPGGGSVDYFALDPSVAPVPVFLLGFGEPLEFTDFIFWGYHFSNPNGNEAKTFTLEFSTDGGATFPESVTVSSPAISQGAATTLGLGGVRLADTIRLRVTDNWFENHPGGDRAGLGEIRFLGATPPNPNPVLAVERLVDFGWHPADPGPLTVDLTIANHGDEQDLVVTPSLDPAGGPFSIPSGTLTIPHGQSVALPVTFDAAGTAGCFRGALVLDTNDPDQPRGSVALTAAVNCVPPLPEAPEFSHDEGVFRDPFTLALSTPTPGAVILFTTDGSEPSSANGQVYEGPFAITGSTQIRAATILPGQPPAIRSRSYVRLAADLQSYASALPIVVVENFSAGTIPNKGWTLSTQTGAGLQQVARQPAFLAVFGRDPGSGTAALASPPAQTSRIGIRVRGAYSSTWTPKPYSLESWKTDADNDRDIKLLGMAEESDWILYYAHPDYDRTLLYNTFIWELSRQTGRWAPDFRFVDVFVNQDGGDLGLADRQGIYVLLEKPKRGSKRLDFSPLSDDGGTGGWLTSINRMDPIPVGGFPAANGATSPQFFHTAGPDRIQSTPPNTAGKGDDIPEQENAFINFEDPNGYEVTAVQRAAIEGWFREFEDVLYDDSIWRDPAAGYRRYLDTTDFIDYFQLLTLARQGDGLLLSMFPWVSSGERKLRMGPMWDFNNGAYSGSATGTLYFRPDRLWYPRLFKDPGFQREYEDRWFTLRRGPLSNANMTAIIDSQAAEITPGLAGQQAGLSTSSWNGRLSTMKSWLTKRADWIDDQFFAPPVFSSPGGVVPAGFQLTLSHHNIGTIRYTLDGGDPLDASLAYTGPITLTQSATVTARMRTSSGLWSAVNEATFVLGTPADRTNLVVSELMYHPDEAHPSTEFIELLNIAPVPIDLTGLLFTSGIDFSFPVNTLLEPGGRLLIVQDRAAFEALHGPDLPVAGEFENSTRLANSGERLTLVDANGLPVFDFAFGDDPPWPVFADGAGRSLTLVLPESNPDPSVPGNWRISAAPGGSPNQSDHLQFAGDPSGILDYALGTSRPTLAEIPGAMLWSYRVKLGADDYTVSTQSSPDLVHWTTLELPDQPATLHPDGTATFQHQLPPPAASSMRFLRLVCTPRPAP